MQISKLPWAKLLAEGGLIIVSVYLAIVLEGMSQDRAARLSAHVALVQMLGDMREDVAELDEVRAHQLAQETHYNALILWLEDPASMPLDSVAEAMDSIFMDNRTFFPRRSAWTTMVADGQLSMLDAPGLVTQLGSFYESVSVRLVEGGAQYEDNLGDIGRNSATAIWDGFNRKLMTTDADQIVAFRNQLRYLHVWGSLWYLSRLDDYRQMLDLLVLDIESYLDESGYELEGRSHD
jgi:hypothetical protein